MKLPNNVKLPNSVNGSRVVSESVQWSALHFKHVLSKFKSSSSSNLGIPFLMEDCRDWSKKKGRCPHCSEDVAGRCNSACGAADGVVMICNDGCQWFQWEGDRCKDCPLQKEGKKDDVDRERCWYVQKGCLLEETKAKGMERGGVKDSANGIAMK